MGQQSGACAQVSRPCSTQSISRHGSKESVSSKTSTKDTSSRKGSKESQAGAAHALTTLAHAVSTEGGLAELKSLFDEIDLDGSGKITSAEWARGVSANKSIMGKYFGAYTEDDICKAFKRLDIDGNDKLTWAEFQLSAKAYGVADQAATAMATAVGRAKWKNIFNFMDRDLDGKITRDEWSKAVMADPDIMKSLGPGNKSLSSRDVAAAFKRLDKDKNGVLDWNEFVAVTASFKATNHVADALSTEDSKAEIRAAFERLDLDADGKISSKEWGRALMRDKTLMGKFVSEGSVVRASDIQRAFERIDADGSGKLTWEEFEQAALRGA
eukprot:TRINITY_DN36460_c0_g1_i1.p1 TRINITY_DN36460_c0_g1~~TRINITY_DN36460_c0_g1_i1.p1  ORF type:complete len:336 (-),score=75.92 TRINITY_DN36460_c0_g1_i1:301-1281(-)